MEESVTHDGSRWSNADDDRIEVQAYDCDWPAKFAAEAAAIRSEVGEELHYSIEHVGSTAVPGLAAKPIIDIVLVMPDRKRWPELVAPLERLGYSYWATNPDPNAMFFVKGMPPFGSGRTHHVHVRSPEALAPLVRFRNFLVANPAEALLYGELKRDLAKRFHRDREAYSAGKTEFVEGVLRKAAGPDADTKLTKENEGMKQDQADKPVLHWETLNATREEDGLLDSKYMAERAKVPGGWLVISQFRIGGAHGITFLPDPNHVWDGGSLV